MLTKEDNEILNHVGPGTPMGNLLRRYWTPALLSEELPGPDCTPVEVRLLGEDLVAFRDTEGTSRPGRLLLPPPRQRHVLRPQRGERPALRLPRLEVRRDTGQCVDMPSEPPTSIFKDKLKIPAYPTHESGGIVWTYMGPKDKMTGFRDFGTEALPREKWRASKRFEPMTWMQWMEGLMDTTHNSWLHHWKGRSGPRGRRLRRARRLQLAGRDGEFWGVRPGARHPRCRDLARLPRRGSSQDAERQHSRSTVCLHHALHLRTGRGSLIVPIDDDTCLRLQLRHGRRRDVERSGTRWRRTASAGAAQRFPGSRSSARTSTAAWRTST